GQFDAIASAGMVEHVGLRKLGQYFRHLRSLLAPNGQILNHGIVTRARQPARGTSFVRTYVFPDGQLHKVEDAIAAAEDAGLELRDVEALRSNYALTLRHWVADLEANAEGARALAGDRTYRIWRLYMAGSAVAFETGAIAVDQLLLADPGRPWEHGRKRLLAVDD
ncbi:MAG TPA: class I SAM-dependent methyltransferase, partial [Acidimicrobiia bacterium]|nr:class I SAM-dependent methyltransferase [Acidimicrobiia bacterium]